MLQATRFVNLLVQWPTAHSRYTSSRWQTGHGRGDLTMRTDGAIVSSTAQKCWPESDVSRDLQGVVFEGEQLREVWGRAIKGDRGLRESEVWGNTVRFEGERGLRQYSEVWGRGVRAQQWWNYKSVCFKSLIRKCTGQVRNKDGFTVWPSLPYNNTSF